MQLVVSDPVSVAPIRFGQDKLLDPAPLHHRKCIPVLVFDLFYQYTIRDKKGEVLGFGID
jgi:hypothetical protein